MTRAAVVFLLAVSTWQLVLMKMEMRKFNAAHAGCAEIGGGITSVNLDAHGSGGGGVGR